MRPAGEVRLALLRAARELATPDRAGTLREIAERACVGVSSARWTIRDMWRAGQLAQVRERPVSYRNRPVWEYAPVMPGEQRGDLVNVLKAWAH